MRATVPTVLTAIFIFIVVAPCCLHAFVLASKAAFTTTAVQVDLIPLGVPCRFTDDAPKDLSALVYVVFGHFWASQIVRMLY